MSKQVTADNLTARAEPTGGRVFSQMSTRTNYLIDVRKTWEKLINETHEIIKNIPDEVFIDNLNVTGEGVYSSEED